MWKLDGPDGWNAYWHDLRRKPRALFRRQQSCKSVMVLGALGFNDQASLVFLKGRFNIVFFAVAYAVPVLCMTVAYTSIGFVLWSSKVIGENTPLQRQVLKSKQQAVHMLIAIVLLFAVCWLPYHLYFLYIYYNKEILHTHFIQHVYLGIYWLAMSNSCYNPIVYYNMNARFKRYFLDAIRIYKKTEDLETRVEAQQCFTLTARTSTKTTTGMTSRKKQSYGRSSSTQKDGKNFDMRL